MCLLGKVAVVTGAAAAVGKKIAKLHRTCLLLAHSRHGCVRCTCLLSGVKQTWPFAEVRFRGRYWVQSGHGVLHCICLLLIQSGH